MALNPVNPIQSGSATATNGSPTITVTGNVDCSFIVPGFVLQLGTRRIVPAVSGTAPVSGTSTITLAANWDQPTTTDVLIGWNSYESLPNIVNRIQNALAQQTAIGELTTNGLIEKTGANSYQTVALTASNTDSTLGRVSRVGDFGLGSGAVFIADANAITATGLYSTAAEWVGSAYAGVSGANQGYLQHYEWGGGYALQRFTDVNSIFSTLERRKNNGVWSGWQLVLREGVKGISTNPNAFISPELQQWVGWDFNTITAGGWFKYLIDANFSAGAPPTPIGGTTFWYVFNITFNEGSYIQQYAYNHSFGTGAPCTFMRTYEDGIWTVWRQASAPAVGTVGFVSGINTGAIIERGVNANGQYTKFADGTMICWWNAPGSLPVAGYGAVAGVYAGTFSWTFPAVFDLGSHIVVSGAGVDQAVVGWISGAAASASTASITYFTRAAEVTSINASLIAIGRWRA